MKKKIILINPPLYFSQGLPHALDVSVPPLGLLYLASYIHRYAPDLFEVEVLDVAADNASLGKVGQFVRDQDPMIVGLTSMTPQLQGTVELARYLKTKVSSNLTIFLGGPHISADPGFIDRHPGLVDYAITGEAEKTFLESVKKLARGEGVPRLQSGEVVSDLDTIPFPDRTLIRRENYSQYESMMFSRGCPYQCYYCSRPSISKQIRYRSVGNLIGEIKATHRYNGGKIDFQDDTLTLDRDRVLEFCRRVREEGLKLSWRCNTRIDLVDEGLFQAMKGAGCELIHFGVEAGNERVRGEVVKKGSFTNNQIRSVFANCRTYGIKVAGYFMLGHPGETKGDLNETKQLILESGLDVLGLSIPTPFPGSALYEIARRRGVVNEGVIDKFARKELGEGYAGVYPVLTSEKVPQEYVFFLMKEINRKFYLNWRTFWKRFKEDVTSTSKLKQDFLDLKSLILRGMSSRKPYAEPHQADLSGAGRSKIVFVAMGTENIAIEFLSSFLKSHGYTVDLVFDPTLFSTEAVKFSALANFFDAKRELVKEIVAKKPDLVGFSVFTLNYQRALDFAREIKKLDPSLPIIFGGIHPTSVPERVIKQDAVDMVCIGEGEYALLELLESLESGRKRDDIKNIWFKRDGEVIKNPCRPLINDLDSLPFPDKDLFYRVYPGFVKDDYYALSSRGCPFACTYCANNVLRRVYQGLGKTIRRRSPRNIIEELVWAKRRYSPKRLTFVDDVFVQDVEWLREFALLYQKHVDLPFVVLTHPRFVTKEIAQLLVDSGCFLLMFGIQSASPETRTKILKRFETNEEIERAASACHQAGLKFSIDHIFNIPGEDIQDYEKALSFYAKLRPSVIHSYWLQYFPGVEIIETAVEKGVMNEAEVEKIEEGLTSTSLVVGFGGEDTFSPELVHTNIQFVFTLLPILPKWMMGEIIRKRLYLIRFRLPVSVNIGLKFLINVLNRRGGVYIGMVKSMAHFMRLHLISKRRRVSVLD